MIVKIIASEKDNLSNILKRFKLWLISFIKAWISSFYIAITNPNRKNGFHTSTIKSWYKINSAFI